MKLNVVSILVLCIFTQSKSLAKENRTSKVKRKPSTLGEISNEVTSQTSEDLKLRDYRRPDFSGGISTRDRGFSNLFDGKDCR